MRSCKCLNCHLRRLLEYRDDYREWRLEVALELRGLKGNMLSLRGRIDRLNALAVSADQTGATLESHLTDVGGQLGQHVSDIEFAASLKNSDVQSEQSGGEQRASQQQGS